MKVLGMKLLGSKKKRTTNFIKRLLIFDVGLCIFIESIALSHSLYLFYMYTYEYICIACRYVLLYLKSNKFLICY